MHRSSTLRSAISPVSARTRLSPRSGGRTTSSSVSPVIGWPIRLPRSRRRRASRCPRNPAPPVMRMFMLPSRTLQIGFDPAQAVRRRGFRPVFTADPAVVAKRIDQVEQVRMIQFAQVRFMPLRHARDLDMANARMRAFHITSELDREITLHDLAVITIELHLEIWYTDLFAYRLRVVLAVEEKAGDVTGIDRFDNDRDTGRACCVRRQFEVLQVHRTMFLTRLFRRDQSRHYMQRLVTEHGGIFQRFIECTRELVLAPRQ